MYCETNDCEHSDCHRCWPRKDCDLHSKCIEFTKSGEAYTDDTPATTGVQARVNNACKRCSAQISNAPYMGAVEDFCPRCRDFLDNERRVKRNSKPAPTTGVQNVKERKVNK